MTASYEGVAKLGFGAMRLPLADPDDVTAIDIEQLKAMMDEFIAKGGTYVDTAFVYHNGASGTALREALSGTLPAGRLHPRHKVSGLGVPHEGGGPGVPAHFS